MAHSRFVDHVLLLIIWASEPVGGLIDRKKDMSLIWVPSPATAINCLGLEAQSATFGLFGEATANFHFRTPVSRRLDDALPCD